MDVRADRAGRRARVGRSGWMAAVLVATAILSGAGAAADQAPPCDRLVATGNPDYPPYLWRDPANPERLIGATADLVERIGQALGVDIDLMYSGPWSRAQEEVRAGRVDLIAGAFLTVPRLHVMDYFHPPLYVTPNMVWVKRGGGFDYQDWGDLRGRVGGTLVNNSFGQEFDAYARANLSIEEVPVIAQAFEKLLLGRTDYVLFELFPGRALTGARGLLDELEVLEPPISSEGLFLTLSHRSACNTAELRGRLAEQVRRLAVEGIPEGVLAHNLRRWSDQQLREAAPR